MEYLSTIHDQLFGFDTDSYNTTMRELLNWGWTIDECLKVVDFTNYRTYKCEAPYFIYGQVSTHIQITSVSHSQRYGTCDRGYWMPPEFVTWFNDRAAEPFMPTEMEQLYTKEYMRTRWNFAIENKTPLQLKTFIKGLGIVRKEVWDRGADMLQNRVFTLGGYTSNPNAFPYFIDQRLDSHTQLETREFVQLIKDTINV